MLLISKYTIITTSRDAFKGVLIMTLFLQNSLNLQSCKLFPSEGYELRRRSVPFFRRSLSKIWH